MIVEEKCTEFVGGGVSNVLLIPIDGHKLLQYCELLITFVTISNLLLWITSLITHYNDYSLHIIRACLAV